MEFNVYLLSINSVFSSIFVGGKTTRIYRMFLLFALELSIFFTNNESPHIISLSLIKQNILK